ncbi:TPA: adenylyltransferase/cytidyltransferase family protein [Campylobacter jejuni]|nr:adenylyltransferase/cytidyltransferase family protein [Campylobacter jejuni]EEP3530269.1 adenylyltransferase/cytidyltransferase family protein [Campylobacter jejuni]HEA8076918.1 adenylyltransferase/cytidyltransferase family protein [Campylobacter jejuni]
MKNVITFGTFDLFHYGHLKILQRAASLGDRLIVGVSSDSLNFAKKSRYPIYSEKERLDIIASLKCVSNVFLEESLELKKDYILKHKADILVMGDDWKGKFDCFNNICEVVYFKRTPSISTTEIIERIRV